MLLLLAAASAVVIKKLGSIENLRGSVAGDNLGQKFWVFHWKTFHKSSANAALDLRRPWGHN
jgi:hypothetical protein